MSQSFYSNDGIWLKGNLHSHSTVSDGFFEPIELAARYAEMGYDFLSMTDHNVYVHHCELPEDKIMLITGVEHDIEYSSDKCTHVVGTGIIGKDKPNYVCRKYSKEELSDQGLVDMMKADGQFVTLAHPVWSRMKPDEVLGLKDFHAIEVYNNGTEHLCHGGNAEVYWDLLLQQGKHIFATASDDVHVPDDLFGGWVMVKAAERSKEAVLKSLHAGHFYASTGPEIHDFFVEDGSAYVSTSPCREIHLVTYESRGKSYFADGNNALSASAFKLMGNEKYIRAVCVDFNGHSAWTQPIFFE